MLQNKFLKVKVLVTEASFPTMLWVIRNLKKKPEKYEVLALDTIKSGGMLSKYADKSIIVKKDNYYDEIIKSIFEYKVDIVFPHLEITYLKLLEEVEKLNSKYSRNTVLISPPKHLISIVINKIKVLNLIKDIVNIPLTRIYELETLDDINKIILDIKLLLLETNKKFIIKTSTEIGVPYGPFNRYIIVSIENFDYIKNTLEQFILKNKQLIFQEYINGWGAAIAGFWWEGKPVAVGGHRRLLESHASGGISVLAESYISEECYKTSLAIMERLRYSGLAMIEFKIRDNDKPYFMEINPRAWGTLPLYVHSGLDIPTLACEFFLGENVNYSQNTFNIGQKMFFLKNLIFSSIESNKLSQKRVIEILKMLPKLFISKECIFSYKDPLPFLYDIVKLLLFPLRKFIKRLKLKKGVF